MKFTEHGSVTLRVESQDHWLILQVKDTGIGTSPEVQSHLFQPFVQGDGTSTRCIGGTGLGSTFEINLPLFGAQYIDQPLRTTETRQSTSSDQALHDRPVGQAHRQACPAACGDHAQAPQHARRRVWH